MENKVALSTLSYEFENLTKIFPLLKEFGADYAHCDIKDGKFVEGKTYTPKQLANIAQEMAISLDVHLMVAKPLKYLKHLKMANYVTIHYESFKNEKLLLKAIKKIKSKGINVGVAIDLDTNVEVLLNVLNSVDLILVMSVKIGKSGQRFNESAIEKLNFLKLVRKERKLSFLIEVDGGINAENVALCVNAGADIVVSGNYVAKAKDKESAIKNLKVIKLGYKN